MKGTCLAVMIPVLVGVLIAGVAPAAEETTRKDPKERVQELLVVIKDAGQFWDVRRKAIKELGATELKSASEAAIPVLIEMMADPPQILRHSAMSVLAGLRPASLPALNAALADPKREMAAVDTFAHMGKEGVAFLTELVAHENPLVRKHAVEALSWMRDNSAGAPALLRCLGDESAEVRLAAAKALRGMGAAAVEPLLRIAGDAQGESALRVAALGALGNIGAAQLKSAAAIAQDRKTSVDVRIAAMGALSCVDAIAIRALTNALNGAGSEPELRVAAAERLGAGLSTAAAEKLGNAIAIPGVEALTKTLLDKAAPVAARVAAADALKNAGAPAAATLVTVLSDPDEQVRWHAAVAMGSLPGDAAPTVAEKLTDANPLMRRYAAFALGKMGNRAKAAAGPLAEALKDKEPAVRRNAAGALGAIGTNATVYATALAGLVADPDVEVALAAVQALGALGKDAAEFAPAIEQVLAGGRNFKIRWAAAYALDRILGPRPPDVKRDKLPVRAYVLNKYIRMLDGQWLGTRVAADGNWYFGAGGHWPDQGSAFFRYDPRKEELKMLSDDMSKVCGEDPLLVPPQGKIHSPVVEKDGWIYFGTHLANYSARGSRAYTGAHLVGYELAGGKFRDFGVVKTNFSNYAAVALDPQRNQIYFMCVDFAEGRDSCLYRIDINTGAKEELGAFRGCPKSACFFIFVDRRGDGWLTMSKQEALYRVRAESGKIERWATAGGGLFWDWAGALPDGDLGLIKAADKFYLLDAAADLDAPGAFFPIKETGEAHLGVNVTQERVYFTTSRPQRLMSFLIDPAGRPAVINHGQLCDQDGRSCRGIWGLDLDREGRLLMIGRWYIRFPGEMDTIGVDRGGEWWCLEACVVDVAEDLGKRSK